VLTLCVVSYRKAALRRARVSNCRRGGVELPSRPERAATKILTNSVPVAAHPRPSLLDEPDLIESVRAAVELVLKNERLAAKMRAQLAEVRASRVHIVAAADNERRRLERDLHDGAHQRLDAMSLKPSLARADADPTVTALLAQPGTTSSKPSRTGANSPEASARAELQNER
jgi:signal transduction histidine kinase